MGRRDSETMGFAGDWLARMRLGRTRGLEKVVGAGLFGPVLERMVDLAEIGPEDNVLVLGATEPLVPLVAPRCLRLTLAEDLGDEDLAALEAKHASWGPRKVQFMRGKGGVIPSPQGTVDKILSFGWLYRARVTEAVMRAVQWVSHHGCRVFFSEPSASLDARTARKYSREAGLSMQDHEALLALARTALAHRGFTPEGLRAMCEKAEMKEVRVGEMLHGLVLTASGTFEF